MSTAALEQAISLARQQGGVISRAQWSGLGMHHNTVARLVRMGQWMPMARGVHQVHPGPPSAEGLSWGGILLGGEGSAVVGLAAAHLWTMEPQMPEVVGIAVPHQVQVRDAGAWHFERRRTMPPTRGLPPRTTVEETVLDLCHQDPTRAEHWVTEAVRRRLTTRAQLRRALARRTRIAGRRDLELLLSPQEEGVESPLEGIYRRDVERAHGLPSATRQFVEAGERRDMYYEEYGLVVELDGRLGHEGAGRFRDMARDNRNTVRGRATLRYGWTDCRHHACETARQVGSTLALLGWGGMPQSCPRCRMQAAA